MGKGIIIYLGLLGLLTVGNSICTYRENKSILLDKVRREYNQRNIPYNNCCLEKSSCSELQNMLVDIDSKIPPSLNFELFPGHIL